MTNPDAMPAEAREALLRELNNIGSLMVRGQLTQPRKMGVRISKIVDAIRAADAPALPVEAGEVAVKLHAAFVKFTNASPGDDLVVASAQLTHILWENKAEIVAALRSASSRQPEGEASLVPTKDFIRWIEENVPLYFNYGDKPVSYTWSADALATDMAAFAVPLLKFSTAPRAASPVPVELREALDEIERISSTPISGTSLQTKANRFDRIRTLARNAKHALASRQSKPVEGKETLEALRDALVVARSTLCGIVDSSPSVQRRRDAALARIYAVLATPPSPASGSDIGERGEKPRPVDCLGVLGCGWHRVKTEPDIGLHMCSTPNCPHAARAQTTESNHG